MSERFAPTRVDWLPNGMRVATRELHHAPVACVMVWYGVGSRNELPGQTGISHFLEHMMFKGTERFPYGVLEEGVKLRGGMWNAFTSYDYTSYYEVLPARHLAYGLEIEADRMVNMTFDPDLTVRERGIIVSEREGHENSPQFWLREAFMQEAYREFPYRHHVLGHKADIQAMTAEALTAHYQRFYRPNNATLVAVGDFETDRLLELAQKHFGSLPRGVDVEQVSAAEPEQTEERRVLVRRPGPNPSLLAGYKIPGAGHPDQAALMVLSAVLSGGPSFGMGGGAAMGRSSRLYRKLVNTGLAAGAGAYPWPLQYPGLFVCSATPVAGHSLAEVEAALFAEIDRLSHDRVPQEELDRAKKQVRAQFVYGMESAISQAYMLGSTALTSSVETFDHAVEAFEAVTPDDILRVAQAYLLPRRRTVGWFEPEEQKGAPSVPKVEAPEAGTGSTPEHQKPGPRTVEAPAADGRRRLFEHERLVRSTLPNGMPLLVYPAKSIPSLVVRLQLEAGAVHDPEGKAGLAQLTAQMLMKGSQAFDAEELALKTDALGLSIRVDIGRETAVSTLKCLPEDLETGLELLAEVLRRPAFPEQELDRMRERFLVAVRAANNDTRSVAGRRLSEALYPEGHPYRNPANGTEESLKGIARADLSEFHARMYGPRDGVITVVGNADPARVEAALRKVFDGWEGGAGRPTPPAVPAPPASETYVALEGKSQCDIALGWPMVGRTHPDYLALDLLATIFGGNGTPASSRLFRDVREKHGTSYYQFATFGGASGPSPWTAHIGVNPARRTFTLDLIKQELKRLQEEPIPERELESLKAFLEDYPAVQLESPERVAARLGEIERFQLGLNYLERYPVLVRALTAEELLRVAKEHLVLDHLSVVIAGPPEDH